MQKPTLPHTSTIITHHFAVSPSVSQLWVNLESPISIRNLLIIPKLSASMKLNRIQIKEAGTTIGMKMEILKNQLCSFLLKRSNAIARERTTRITNMYSVNSIVFFNAVRN